MEFFNYDTDNNIKKGSILISEPFLPDSNFERTVILICEHTEEGSVGFVMNKPSTYVVKDVMEGGLNIDNRVFIGGPVQRDSFHYIHKDPNIDGAVPVRDGLYWGGEFDELKSKSLSGYQFDNFKFFIGYSGWSEGQLENEMKDKSWIVSNDLDANLLFSEDTEDIWKKALKYLGGRFELYSEYPVDPRMN